MASVIPVKLTPQILLALAVLILGVGFGLGKYVGGRSLEGFATADKQGRGTSGSEGFQEGPLNLPICRQCQNTANQCNCPVDPKNPGGAGGAAAKISQLVCPPCRQPDMSKYVLKTTIPPCPACPDLSNYMLKTECPPVPDLSKYVLKSSIPKQQPVIIDNSACKKEAGECPPCPRPRCPEVKCPPPTTCPPPAPCPRPVCPPTTVKCKAEGVPDSTVRPYLAPLNMGVFGE
jgi:hypothetical protein